MHASLKGAHNLHDLRDLARRRLPRGIFEYIDRGAEDETALRENRAAFERIRLLPRVLEDVSTRDASIELFGRRWSMPVAVAPTGSAGLVWYRGELELARAAESAGIPFTLATNAMTSMEKIAEGTSGPRWFQLNMFADRTVAWAMLERAADLGYDTLLLTADASVVPNREYNARNGFSVPFRLSSGSAIDMLRHPGWLASVMGRYWLGDGMPRFENLPPHLRGVVTGFATGKSMPRCEDLSWTDLVELRRRWRGQLVVKGVLRRDDAVRCAEYGADAVLVSNHGGRCVDSAPAPIDVLPGIVEALGGRIPVLLDGGIRRGSDVVKALALGARAVLVGRPTLFGTALAGREGAAHALRLLQTEIEREMGLLGCRRIADLTADLLYRHATTTVQPRDPSFAACV